MALGLWQHVLVDHGLQFELAFFAKFDTVAAVEHRVAPAAVEYRFAAVVCNWDFPRYFAAVHAKLE